MSRLHFHELKKNYELGVHISHAQHIIIISSGCPFLTLGMYGKKFQIRIHCYKNFIVQRSIGQQKVRFSTKKCIIKNVPWVPQN